MTRRKADDRRAAAIGDPYHVVPVDGDTEGCLKSGYLDQSTLLMIAAREMHELVARGIDNPHIAVRGIANTVHHSELATEVDTGGSHQWLTLEVKD
ncbi:hypothetical protein D3C85_1221380 [compost metagenome]